MARLRELAILFLVEVTRRVGVPSFEPGLEMRGLLTVAGVFFLMVRGAVTDLL